MDAETDINGHGGAREGAGRKAGRPSLRRAAQAIIEVEEAFPGWSPVLHLAAVANDKTLPAEVRLDAAKAAAPFLHSRPKPVEMEPDALVDLERRLMAAKIEETAKAIKVDDGLADRLARAKKRNLAAEVFEVFDALTDAAEDAEMEPAPAHRPSADPAPRPTLREPRNAPAVTPVAPGPELTPEPEPVAYTPILPRPDPAPWPDRPAITETEYDPFG